MVVEMLVGHLLFELPDDDRLGDHLAMIERALGEKALRDLLWRTESREIQRDYLREMDDGFWRLQSHCYEAKCVKKQDEVHRLISHVDPAVLDLILQMLTPNHKK